MFETHCFKKIIVDVSPRYGKDFLYFIEQLMKCLDYVF